MFGMQYPETLASVQHVGVWPIILPGGGSWKQPCSFDGQSGMPLHDVDDDGEYPESSSFTRYYNFPSKPHFYIICFAIF